MKSDDEEPRWDRLPHDPLGFFGLDPGFDRKDLKRSYNRWLRRFKPERHPEEFLRIRAAYEALDERLRYLAEPPERGETPTSVDIARYEARSQAPMDTAASRDYGDEIARRGPRAVSDELRNRADKSPRDHLHLALLSDVVDDSDSGDFVGWLVDGLRRWPESPELRSTLYAYCHRPEAVHDAETLVERLAGVGDPALFGYLSERLWLQFAARAPFEHVAASWARCRRKLRADHHPATLQLAATLFRAGLFDADDGWLGAAWDELEDAGLPVPDPDLLEALYEYRARRDEFVAAHPLRGSIDRALQAIAAGEIVAADRAFLAMQFELGSAGGELLEAFPDDDRDWWAPLAALEMWRHELTDRLGPSHATIPTSEFQKRMTRFVRRIDRLGSRSPIGMAWLAAVTILTAVIPLVVAIAGVRLIFDHTRAAETFLAASLAWCLLILVVWRRVVWPKTLELNDWFARRVHRRVWRPELVAFLESTGIDLSELLDGLSAIRERPTSLSHIRVCVSRDVGLRFAALARHAG